MRRRNFLGFVAAVAAQPVLAQPAKQYRIALVIPAGDPARVTEPTGGNLWQGFFAEMRRLNYIEQANLLIERYSAEGKLEHSADLARRIAERKPDLIVTIAGRMARALDLPDNAIPIVTTMADPIRFGFVKSLARPGGNITGVAIDAGLEILSKRLQLLKELSSSVQNVAFLTLRSGWDGVVGQELRQSASGLGIRLIGATVAEANPVEYQRVFTELEQERPDAMIVSEAAEHFPYRELISQLAAKGRLPAIYPWHEFVQAGGLMTYATDLTEVGRRMAGYVDQIFKGAKAGDIPVYQPTKFELVINLKTAKALGLTVPPSLLARADEVIE